MSYFTFANGVNKMLFGDETTPDELLKQSGTCIYRWTFRYDCIGEVLVQPQIKNEKKYLLQAEHL